MSRSRASPAPRASFAAAMCAVMVLVTVLAGCQGADEPPSPAVGTKAGQTEAPAAGRGFYGLAVPPGPTKVIYVIDNSGIMTCSMDFVKFELKRSIDQLGEGDEFHILFCSPGPPLEMPNRRPVPATPANKAAATEFIDNIMPSGELDPSEALRRAFACTPDDIFLLTEGRVDTSVAEFIKKANAGGKVRVHTIAYLSTKPCALLRQIARQNGGRYRFVHEWDLVPSASPPKRDFYDLAVPPCPTKVVYVLDHAGNMTSSLDFVKYELLRSIEQLGEGDEFHVVFYSSGPPLEMPARHLVPATAANKEAATEFIDGIEPQGGSDPADALRRAFACRPDGIFLLTQNRVDPSVIDLIKEANANGKVRVHTIAFLYKTSEAVLKQIAAQNSGGYRFWAEQDLAR